MRKREGFGLVEMMVVFLISLILFNILIHLFYHVRRETNGWIKTLEEEMSLQWVMAWMRHSIQLAGFTPCCRIDYLKVYDVDGQWKQYPIVSFDQKNQSLHIYRMEDQHIMDVTKIEGQTVWVKSLSSHAKKNQLDKQLMILSDCVHAELHYIALIDLNENRLVLSEPILFDYDPHASLGEWKSEFFYVKKMQQYSGLFYDSVRADRIFSPLLSWIVEVTNDASPLVKISLKPPNHQEIYFETRVRMPG